MKNKQNLPDEKGYDADLSSESENEDTIRRVAKNLTKKQIRNAINESIPENIENLSSFDKETIPKITCKRPLAITKFESKKTAHSK